MCKDKTLFVQNYLNEVEWIASEIDELKDEILNSEGTFIAVVLCSIVYCIVYTQPH